MKRLAIFVFLVLIILIAGCVMPGGEAPGDNNTTTKVSKPPRGVKYISEQEARDVLNGSEAVELFLGLYADAELDLKLEDCCGAAITYDFSCDACGEEKQGMWVATYSKGTTKVIIGMDARSGEEIGLNPGIEYLRSGKYCKSDDDCINIGSLYSSMCINYIYTLKSGAACDGSLLGCRGSMECCKCSGNVCTGTTVPLSTADCPTSTTSSATGPTEAEDTAPSGPTTVSCDSISEVLVGKTITSENKKIELLGIYQEGISYKAKFRVTSEEGTSTKYVEAGTTEHAAGVEIHVSDIAVSMGGEADIVTVYFSGLGSSCTIE